MGRKVFLKVHYGQHGLGLGLVIEFSKHRVGGELLFLGVQVGVRGMELISFVGLGLNCLFDQVVELGLFLVGMTFCCLLLVSNGRSWLNKTDQFYIFRFVKERSEGNE